MWRRLRDRLENNSNILLFRTNPSQELSIPRHYPTSRADGSRQLCVHQSLKFLFIRQLPLLKNSTLCLALPCLICRVRKQFPPRQG